MNTSSIKQNTKKRKNCRYKNPSKKKKVKCTYDKKEDKDTQILKKQKRDVNNVICNLTYMIPTCYRKIKKNGTLTRECIVAIDNNTNNTRNIFNKKFIDENIITCNNNLTNNNITKNTKNENLIDLLKNFPDEILCLFADTTQQPKNAIAEIMPAFERKLFIDGSVLALTVCVGRVNAKDVDKQYKILIKKAIKNNYILEPIEVSNTLRLNKPYTIHTIRNNMADNGAIGRAMTWFFRVFINYT